MEERKMILTIVLAALLSIEFVSVDSGTVEKCLEGNHHKKFPSPEGPDFAGCFAWKDKSCCSAETTKKLKTTVGSILLEHIDWEYCGGLSESCRQYLNKNACFYFCDPNLFKWQAVKGGLISGVPICRNFCDEWFEACKNDKTYSENWLDDSIMNRSNHGPIKPKTKCRTFAEVFHDGKGMCNKIWGPSFKYETSSNCMVMDFKGQNPNDKVTKA